MLGDMNSIKNVLYIDDDGDDRQFFNDACKTYNSKLEIVLYESGYPALIHVKNSNKIPDLIFLDINLPGINGHEILSLFRKNKLLTQTPVVIYSTSSNQNDVRRAYINGANLYVVKPMSFDSICYLVKEIFSMDWKEYFPTPSKENFLYKLSSPDTFQNSNIQATSDGQEKNMF